MLKRLNRSSPLKNKKGMAVLELIPILFIYMLLINFSLGFFGAIHAGILHNIAARNYAFETMRHRSNLVYHRTYSPTNNFAARGYRFGGIIYDNATLADSSFTAPKRPIAFTSAFGGNDKVNGIDLSDRGPAGEPNAKTLHNATVGGLNNLARNENISVSQIWIKSLYGICINSQCGDN
jgi:hypothetical protein